MTEEQELEMAYQALREVQMEENRQFERIIKAIESVRGEAFVSEVNEWLTELDMVYEPKLVREPKGRKQSAGSGDYEHTLIKEEWCDEYKNGGYTGDSYSGYAAIEVKPGLFFQVHYSM